MNKIEKEIVLDAYGLLKTRISDADIYTQTAHLDQLVNYYSVVSELQAVALQAKEEEYAKQYLYYCESHSKATPQILDRLAKGASTNYRVKFENIEQCLKALSKAIEATRTIISASKQDMQNHYNNKGGT